MIPVYHKTKGSERPDDPIFYWVTKDGVFLCKNQKYFSCDSPAKVVSGLEGHEALFYPRLPKIPKEGIQKIVGFFDAAYEAHASEAIVLLFWDEENSEYIIHAPEQSVMKNSLRVDYEMPQDMVAKYQLFGDIHSHANVGAHFSHVDDGDDELREGLHGVIGKVNTKQPEIKFRFTNGKTNYKCNPSFVLDPEVEKGFKRDYNFPEHWMDQIKVVKSVYHGAQYPKHYGNHSGKSGVHGAQNWWNDIY